MLLIFTKGQHIIVLYQKSILTIPNNKGPYQEFHPEKVENRGMEGSGEVQNAIYPGQIDSEEGYYVSLSVWGWSCDHPLS